MATESASRPLRVLALHGYLQTGQILRERTGPLRRALKKRVEFIFLDGPYPAFSNEEHLKRDDGKRIEGKGDDVVEGRGWCGALRWAGPRVRGGCSRGAMGRRGRESRHRGGTLLGR